MGILTPNQNRRPIVIGVLNPQNWKKFEVRKLLPSSLKILPSVIKVNYFKYQNYDLQRTVYLEAKR